MPAFVHFPAELLTSVRTALTNDRPPMEAVNLLRQVGFELGGAVDEALRAHVSEASGGAAPESISADEFWRKAADFFHEMGWGRVEHHRLHRGVGGLDLLNWVESGAGGGPPGAHISTGLFTDLLGRLAGGPVVVMEVPGGVGWTRLLFGSGETMGAVYQSISGGASLDEALKGLGMSTVTAES
jgi:hypothetical protein